MVTPNIVHTATAASTPTMGSPPIVLTTVNVVKPPTMMISPWAKFSIFAIPYTMVYPRAMIA